VQKGTAAAKAESTGPVSTNTENGQVAVGGDIIVSIDGKKINGSEELAAAISGHKPGQTVKLAIDRQRQRRLRRQDRDVTLGARPDSVPNRAPEGRADPAGAARYRGSAHAGQICGITNLEDAELAHSLGARARDDLLRAEPAARWRRPRRRRELPPRRAV
jgi:hypothetical protein